MNRVISITLISHGDKGKALCCDIYIINGTDFAKLIL